MSRMSSLATIRELTTWANMRLTSHSLPCDNILTGLMEGETMKCLAESKEHNYIHVIIKCFRLKNELLLSGCL